MWFAPLLIVVHSISLLHLFTTKTLTVELQQARASSDLGAKLRIKTRQETAKLLLHFSFTSQVNTLALAFAFLRGLKVTGSIWRNAQKVTMYQDVSLLTIQEIQTSGEGVIPSQTDAASNILKLSASIDIGVDGAVDLDGESEFDISIDGFDDLVTAGYAGNVAVSTITGPLVSTMVPEIVSIYAQEANRTQRLDLVGFETLAIPFTGFERLTLHYTNGRDQEFSGDDLNYIQSSFNDLLLVTGGATSFAIATYRADHCVVDVSMVNGVTIQKPENTSFRMEAMKSVLVSNGREALSINSALVPAV